MNLDPLAHLVLPAQLVMLAPLASRVALEPLAQLDLQGSLETQATLEILEQLVGIIMGVTSTPLWQGSSDKLNKSSQHSSHKLIFF